MIEDNDAKIRAIVARVRSKIRIEKVVSTRSIKGPGGDTFVGFSAAWDTVKDDSLRGLDGALVNEAVDRLGLMTVVEARVARLLMGCEADIGAIENAIAGGNIAPERGVANIKAVKHNYSKLLRDNLSGE